MNTIATVIITAVIILSIVGIIFKYYYNRITALQKYTQTREVAHKMGRHFPEFSNEFSEEKMEMLLKAREEKDKLRRAERDNMLEAEKRGQPVDWISYTNGADEFSSFMRPFMSKKFCDFVASDIIREKTVNAILFDSILIAGNAKLRVWVDKDGNDKTNMEGESPPDWW